MKYLIFTLATLICITTFSQSKKEGLKRISGNDDDDRATIVIDGSQFFDEEIIEDFEHLAEDLALSELKHLGGHDGETFDFNFAFDFLQDFNFNFNFDFKHDFDIDHDFDHDFDFDFDHDFDIDLDIDEDLDIDLGNLGVEINQIVEDALLISEDAVRMSRDARKEKKH